MSTPPTPTEARPEMTKNETAALVRRIDAAIFSTDVSRFAVMEDWPECHRKGCHLRHADPSGAMGTIQRQIARSVRNELEFHSTTQPDVTDDGDTPTEAATYILAALLNRYNVHDAGTFVKAARLIVEAYPALIHALTFQIGESA